MVLMNKKVKRPKILNSLSNLEAEIGHMVVNAEVKEDINRWIESYDRNIEKCLVIWITKDTGQLKLFGTNMKCIEAIGYLEVAKDDLLDLLYEGENDLDGKDYSQG